MATQPFQSSAGLARGARAAVELSVHEFALVLGSTPHLVSEWERGAREPSPAEAKMLRLVLDRPEVCLELIAQIAGEKRARRRVGTR